VARSPDLATSPTEEQVSNPDSGGRPAVRQTAERKGPATFWHPGNMGGPNVLRGIGFVFAALNRSILIQPSELTRFASIPNWLCLALFSVPGPPQRERPDTPVASARCFHLHGRHPSSPRTGQSSCGTRHLPSAIPDSEFGDRELGPVGMHHMLRNATFSGFFANLRNQVLTQAINQ